MTSLYEISADLKAAFDAIYYDETSGQIVGWEDLEMLTAEFNAKVENTACYLKNLKAEAAGIEAEEMALRRRRIAKEKKIKWLERYLSECLLFNGREEFETPRCRVSFRRSKQVNIIDEEKLPTAFVKIKEVRQPDKLMIKESLAAGVDIPGAELVENRNIQIK